MIEKNKYYRNYALDVAGHVLHALALQLGEAEEPGGADDVHDVGGVHAGPEEVAAGSLEVGHEQQLARLKHV